MTPQPRDLIALADQSHLAKLIRSARIAPRGTKTAARKRVSAFIHGLLARDLAPRRRGRGDGR